MWGIIWLGFSTVIRWLNSVIQENPFRLYFQGQAKRCFLAGQRRVKQVQDPCRRRHTVFLTASSCNRDKIAGNLIRFVPLDFLKDERQCQTLKTITSCLYKQPLVSLDINQSLGHLLSMPIGLAPALSPWLARKVTGSGMRHLVLQKTISQFCHWWLSESTSCMACLNLPALGVFQASSRFQLELEDPSNRVCWAELGTLRSSVELRLLAQPWVMLCVLVHTGNRLAESTARISLLKM